MMNAPPFPEAIELQVGPINAVDLALYAAASGDLNPLHLDADVARAVGIHRPIAQGMRTMACVGRLFTEHFGATTLRALNTRFIGTAGLGDVLLLRATLTHVADDIASYDLTVQTSSGAPVASGHARVAHRLNHAG
jgi:acyl dehydratase